MRGIHTRARSPPRPSRSMLSLPSEAVVCVCRSPRMSRQLDQLRQLACHAPRRFRRDLRASPARRTPGPASCRSSASVLLATRFAAAAASPVFFSAFSYSSSLYRPHSLSVIPLSCASPRMLDVVILRAGEVEQRRAEVLVRHDPQIDLQSAGGDDARLGRCPGRGSRSTSGNFTNAAVTAVPSRVRSFSAADEIHIADRLPPPPQAAGDLRPASPASSRAAASTSASAIGSASTMPIRPRRLLRIAIPCLIDSIFFSPSPSIPSSCPSSIALTSSSMLVMLRSFQNSAIVFGPSPGICSIGISPAGTLAATSS